MTCGWTEIHGFAPPGWSARDGFVRGEYARVRSMLDAQIADGVVEFVAPARPQEGLPFYGDKESWFRCTESGAVWRLVEPHDGVTGKFEPMEHADALELRVVDPPQAPPRRTCPCAGWNEVRGFDSWEHYRSFESMIGEAVADGRVEPVPVAETLYPDGERWLRCRGCGRTWRFVPPDPPFAGVFEPVDAA